MPYLPSTNIWIESALFNQSMRDNSTNINFFLSSLSQFSQISYHTCYSCPPFKKLLTVTRFFLNTRRSVYICDILCIPWSYAQNYYTNTNISAPKVSKYSLKNARVTLYCWMLGILHWMYFLDVLLLFCCFFKFLLQWYRKTSWPLAFLQLF